ERVRIDVVEAPDIDRDHLAAVRPLAAREGLDTAGRAEEMMDDVLVELKIGRRAFACEQLEIARRGKGEQVRDPAATRAIARYDLADVGRDFVAHGAALASARMGLFHWLLLSAASGDIQAPTILRLKVSP